MAARAQLKARLTLDKSVFDRGIAGAMAGARRLQAGLMTAGRVAMRGFTLGAVAVAGFSTAVAIGTKRAFDLGGRLSDIQMLTGRTAKQTMVMRRALMDAGVEMGKIDTYMITGRDRGNVIARTLASLTQEDWAAAAASVGHQADILNRSASKFDRISDLLGHAGEKFQGFFVGVADRVADTILPILERLDKTDLAGFGQRFGIALVAGAQTLVGMFNNPKLMFGAMENYFKATALGMGNVLIAAFDAALQFFHNGFLSMIMSAGSSIVATMMDAFETPIAYLQAGIERAIETLNAEKPGGGSTSAIDFQIGAKEKVRDLFGKNMSGNLNSYGRSLQEDIEKLKQRREEIVKTQPAVESLEDKVKRIRGEGVRIGFDNGGAGMTSQEWRQRAREQANAGFSGAASAVRGLSVTDVLGARTAMHTGNRFVNAAMATGAGIIPHTVAQAAPVSKSWWGGATAPAALTGGGQMNTPYNFKWATRSAQTRADEAAKEREKEAKDPASKEDMDTIFAKYFE